MKKNIIIGLAFVFALIFTACEDFLDVEPSDQKLTESFESIADAKLVANGLYGKMQSNDSYNCHMIAFNDVRADDMQSLESGRLDDEYAYNYEYDDFDEGVWQIPYEIIRNSNLLLSFVEKTKPTTDAEIADVNEIKAHALALRALSHFDLVRMFGIAYSHNTGDSYGVPVIESVLNKYDKPKRNTVSEVYTSVVKDLEAAILLLSDEKNTGQINVWGAKALLARVFLYMERNKEAFDLAQDVIDNGGYSIIKKADYLNAWSKEYTSESIFTLVNTAEDNGSLGSIGYFSDPEGYGQFVATVDFIDLMDSKPNDVRGGLLFNDKNYSSRKPKFYNSKGRVLKYPGIGNTIDISLKRQSDGNAPLVNATYVNNIDIIRLSEVCLIAAEAALKHNNDQTNAKKYLNMVVQERDETAVVLADLTLDRVLEERRMELVAEGHRFFDLVRNKRDIVRKITKRAWAYDYKEIQEFTIPYTDHKVVFPIPEDELLVNPMVQNAGYGAPY